MDGIVLILPLLPLLAALIIGLMLGLRKAKAHEIFTARLSLSAMGLTTLASISLVIADCLHKTQGIYHLGHWLHSEDLNISLNLVTTGFRVQTAAVSALLLLLIARFSIDQLQREVGLHRYFLSYNLFAAALFILLLADNLLIIFIGWSMTSVLAYSFIAYAYTQPAAAFNATRVFLTHRFGDAFLLLGIGFSYSWLGLVDIAELVQMVADLELNETTVLGVCFAIAGAVRSAQWPFIAWSTRSMEGSTVSNALLLGSMLSHSGVFLLIILRVLFEQSPLAMALLVILGILTVSYSWLVSLTQTDLKSALSFAIVGQLGLMFLECGLGWWQLALWHMLLHAVLRIYQILYIPSFLIRTHSIPVQPLLPQLAKLRWIYVAALQRFWLDPFADWLLVKPLLRLGKDLSYFDDHIVNALMGSPAPAMNALATLAQLEEQRHNAQLDDEPENFAKGHGLAGKLAENAATTLQWIEQHWILSVIQKGISFYYGQYIGKGANRIEYLLLRPRYLSMFAFITLLVVF